MDMDENWKNIVFTKYVK